MKRVLRSISTLATVCVSTVLSESVAHAQTAYPAQLSPGATTSASTRTLPSETQPTNEITPTGLLVLNGFANTRAVVNADVPLFAAPGPLSQPAVGMSVRQSRFGVNARLGTLARAVRASSLQATFEMDFYGAYLTQNNNYFAMPLPRLRLFNVAISWGAFKLVAGQDWTIFAPLNPDSVSHVAIAGFNSSGNLWMRYPQVRGELKAGPFDFILGVLAPAIGGPVAAMEPVTAAFRTPSTADLSGVPSVQGRAAVNAPMLGKTVTFGVSGHYGMVIDTAMERHSTWGVAADLNLPIGSVFTLKGEAYYGAGLSGMFSNAGILKKTGVPLETMGGWAQALLKLGRLGLQVGAGADSPQAPSGGVLPDLSVSLNWSLYAAVTFAIAPKFNVGLEYERLETTLAGKPEVGGGLYTASQVNAGLQLGF